MPSTNRFFRFLAPLLLCAVPSLLAFAPGCATAPSSPSAQVFSDATIADARSVFSRIDEENRTTKRSSAWIGQAYGPLLVRNYRSLDADATQRLRSTVKDQEAYIIVHPAYYTFFMHDYEKVPVADDTGAGFPTRNLAERLRDALPGDQVNYRVMWEQERLIRDFLEYMASKQRLVLLVLPHDFRSTAVYHSPRGLDEYVRFINEVTDGSPATLYLESITWDTGTVSAEEARNLRDFLSALGVQRILLGGGYVGKCLDNFYESLRTVYPYDDVSFVPELTSISPRDMASDKLRFLRSDGRLNMKVVRRYFDKAGFTPVAPGEKMPLHTFSLYPIYQLR